MTLVARAQLASLLSKGFAYPTADLMSRIRTGSYLAEISALAGPAGIQERVSPLAGALLESSTNDPFLLEGEYTRLFERSVPCPLNESGYAGARGMGAVHDIAHVASFYAAFGFKVSPETKELADHLCVELEFLGVLLAKEAYALEHGWEERARVTRDARLKYASEHLAPWLPKLGERLGQHSASRFYQALFGLAMGLTELEAAGARPAGGDG
jgi:TorA maturation chaperone TorD